MKRNIFIFSSFVMLIFMSNIPISGEFKLKTYDDYKNNLDKVYDSAKFKQNESDWERFVNSGIDTLKAQWIADAEIEIKAELDQRIQASGVENADKIKAELDLIFNDNSVKFNADSQKEKLTEKGAWLADVISVLMPAFNRKALDDAVELNKAAFDSKAINDAFASWQKEVGTVYNSLVAEYGISTETSKQSTLESAIALVWMKDEALQGFTDELTKRFDDLKKERLRLEEIYVIKKRNTYFYERTADTDSLKRESEAASAEAVASVILSEASGKADDIMSGALFVSLVEDSVTGLPLTLDESEDRIRNFIDAGLSSWRQAEEAMLGARLDWERRAFRDYDSADDVWKIHYEKLVKAKNDWLAKARAQIFEGNILWQAKFEKTEANYKTAVNNLDKYIDTQNETWDDYSSGVRQMVITGSSALSTAAENLAWLTEFSKELEGLSDKDSVDIREKADAQIREWKNTISRFRDILSDSESQYHFTDMNDLLTDGRYKSDGTEVRNYYYYKDGENVLVNGSFAVSNDPYLMTSDEFELELLKIEKAYWEERKNRTELVYNYAVNETSRLSKDEQLAKLESAKLELAAKKSDYEKSITTLSEKILPALNDAKNNMQSAADVFASTRKTYDKARDDYKAAMAIVYTLTSPDAMRIAVDDMNEAVSMITGLSNRINDKESEWLLRAKDYYGALSIQEKSESAALYAQRLKAAIDVKDGIESGGGYREAYQQFKDIVLTNGSLNFSGNNFDTMISAIDSKKDILFKTVTPPVIKSENFITYMKEASDEIAAARVSYEAVRESVRTLENLISGGELGSWKTILFQYNNGKIKSDTDLQSNLDTLAASCSDQTSSGCSDAIKIITGSTYTLTEQKVKEVLTANSTDTNKTKLELTKLFYQGIAKIYPESDPLAVSDSMSENQLRDYVISLASKELLNRKTILQSSVITALNSVKKAKDVSDEIVRYLLTDMSIVDTSNDTLAKINERITNGNKNLPTEKAKANIEIAANVKDFLNEFSGDTGSNLYNRMISAAITAINNSENTITASKNIEIYNYIKNLKPSILLIEKASADSQAAEYDKLLNQTDKIITLLGNIENFYSVEIYGLTETQIKDKFTEYKKLIIKPAITDAEKEKLSAYIMEILQPGLYNNFFNTQNYIIDTYSELGKDSALSAYAAEFYSNSFEKTANLKAKGVKGIIADILGLAPSDTIISEIETGGITYTKLKEYGTKLTSFVQGDEYGSLPAAIRKSIEETVSTFKSMIRAREIYDAVKGNVNAAELKEQKKKFTELADAAEKIMNGLSDILDVKQKILKSDSGDSFSNVAGAGKVLTSLEKLSADIESFTKKIDEAEFGTGFNFSLTGDLEDIRNLKAEVFVYTKAYEYITGGSVITLSDYQAILLGQNVDAASVEKIGSIITKYNIKNNIIEEVIKLTSDSDQDDLTVLVTKFNSTTPAGITSAEYKQMYESLVNEVYADSINNIVGIDENFNALLVDTSFRDYGMSLHFQEYIRNKFFKGEYKSFKEIFGSIDDDVFSGGEFANLTQYSSSPDYLKTLTEGMKKIYFTELANSLAGKILPDDETVETFKAENYSELVLHFEKYIEKNYSTELNYEAYLTGFKALYDDADPFKVEITNNSVNLEGVYDGLFGKNLIHPVEFLAGNKAGAYLLEKDYYSALLNSITYNADFMEIDGFVSIYNMNLSTSPALASIKDELTSYGNILQIAYDYNCNGNGDIEKFLKDKNITDTKQENFLRLFAIDPSLASPEYLMDATGETDLALSSSLMKSSIETMYSRLTTGAGKPFIDRIRSFFSDMNEAAWLKGEALDAITAGEEGYKHYRDFIQTAQNKYEVYFNPNDRFQTTAMDELILSKEKESKIKQAQNPVVMALVDSNGNGRYDAGETTCSATPAYYDWLRNVVRDSRMAPYTVSYDVDVDGFVYTEYIFNPPSDAELLKIFGITTYTVSYFVDTNLNGTWEPGEKTIADFYNEYKTKGYGLHPIETTVPDNADAMVSDLIHSNMMQYFKDSRVNELVEEMSMFNRSLLKMVAAAKIEIQDISDIKVRKDLQLKENGTYDYYEIAANKDFGKSGLIDSLTLAGKIMQIALANFPGTEAYSTEIKNLLNQVYDAQRSTQGSLVSTMVESTLANLQQAEAQLLESKQKIKENGAVLINTNLIAYMNGPVKKAETEYLASKNAFEKAKNNNISMIENYSHAKTNYTNHLEIISILFNKLEAARVKFEDEQAVYDYASTAYLYTTGTGVSKTGTDAIKSDAFEDFNLAKKMQEEIDATYEEVLKKAKVSREQNPMSDATYKQLATELKVKSERAYRIEKTKVLLDREVKARSFEYEQAKRKFETARDEIFKVTGEDQKAERNKLADRFMDSNYINGALYSDIMSAALVYNVYGGAQIYKTTAVYNLAGIEASANYDVLQNANSPMWEYYNDSHNLNKIFRNSYIERMYASYLNVKENKSIADIHLGIMLPITITLAGVTAAIAALAPTVAIPFFGWFGSSTGIVALTATAIALGISIGIEAGIISEKYNKANSAMSMYNSDLNTFKSKLNNMKNLKITMYEKQANLAELTQIESLDDAATAGVIQYIDPATKQVVPRNKLTLKGAFNQIAAIYGYENELTEDDLKFLTRGSSIRPPGYSESAEDFIIDNYKSASMEMALNGDMILSDKKFFNASEIANAYSDQLEKRRQDKLKEYYSHTITMGQAGYSGYTNGYDMAIMGKANEKLFYEIFRETGEEKYKLPSKLKVPDEVSARAFNGYTKAAIEYFGAVEGYDTAALLNIESKIGNPELMLSTFKQYDDSFMGLAEMELAQKKALQQRKWEISWTQLSDKKKRWDALTQRILTRGVEQWSTMDAAYREKWKQWRVESDKGILEGQKAWDAKWTALKDKKVRWFENISKDISEEDMKSRLAEITETANSFTADVNERYGNIITNADVSAVLADIMKDSPSLLSQDMLDRIKEEDMQFAITTFSDLKADTVLYGTFSELMNKYENDIQKTRNLKLIDALTKLLQTLADRILEADEDARNNADNYAAGEGYSREGDQYTSRELLTQQVAAYKQFNFTRSLLVPDEDMNEAVIGIDNLPDWQYESMLGILMKQAKINFEGVMDKNNINSLPTHVGSFAVIAPASNFFVGLIGMNDVNGGSGEWGRISRQIGNQRNGNNAIMGSMKLAKTIASIWSGAGAIVLGVADLGSQAASGEMTFDEAGVEGGKSALKGVLSGLAGTLLKKIPYVGPILGSVVSAGINIGIGGIKYDHNKGFDYKVTAQDAIMAGISLAGDLANIGIDGMAEMDTSEFTKNNMFAMKSIGKFGTSFMLNTLAGGIKFDASGNPVGYGFNGLNALDGLVTATSGLISGYASNPSQNGDYATSYAISSGSKFLSGLLKGALYETVDSITGQNNTVGMGIKNLAYSFSDTMGFFGSYYGSKLGEAARKAAEDNATKRESTIGSAILPKDDKEGFRLISDESRKELENFNRAVETKQYLDDKMNKGVPLTDNELLVYYELKNSLGEKLTEDEKQEYKDIAKEHKINLTDRLIDTSKDSGAIMEDDPKYKEYFKSLFGPKMKTFSSGVRLPITENLVEGKDYYISSDFYNIRKDDKGRDFLHGGLDIYVKENSDVLAAQSGKVIFSGENRGGYGYVIVIDHGDNLYSLVAHNNELLVEKGDLVEAGQKIAKSGSTGFSTGPHIHYEIYKGPYVQMYNHLNRENHKDPLKYLWR